VVPWAHPSPQPEQHVDRFSRFCRAHDRDRQTDRPTDRPTDHATPSVTVPSTYLRIYASTYLYVVLRCGLKCHTLDQPNYKPLRIHYCFRSATTRLYRQTSMTYSQQLSNYGGNDDQLQKNMAASKMFASHTALHRCSQ